MTVDNLIALINLDDGCQQAGRAFFATEITLNYKRDFLLYLLENALYEKVAKLMMGGHIVKQYSNNDYISMAANEGINLQARYFDLFLDVATECGIDEEKIMPMLFAAPRAEKGTLLRDFTAAIEGYLLKLCYRDYVKAQEHFLNYDKQFDFTYILIKADRPNAMSMLVNLAISGKNVNKTALRKFLRAYKADVVAELKPKYFSYKTNDRIAAVRLLLLYKNDIVISEFLTELKASEKSKMIVSIIDGVDAKCEDETAIDAADYFTQAMISGKSFSLQEFNKLMAKEQLYSVAAELFFSVYRGGNFNNIVIVHDKIINDLNNMPITLTDDCQIKVLHPVEISVKNTYLKQLNITQPFEQIKRTVYMASDKEKNFNIIESRSGTLVNTRELKLRLKEQGFKPLSRDKDGFCTCAGKTVGEVLCVLNFAPVNFALPEARLVAASDVKFFKASDTIKLNGQIYVDGVPPHLIKNIDARVFSEFMYSVNAVLGY